MNSTNILLHHQGRDRGRTCTAIRTLLLPMHHLWRVVEHHRQAEDHRRLRSAIAVCQQLQRVQLLVLHL